MSDASAAELMKAVLDARLDPAIAPELAVVGGANHEQQEAGVVALMDAGTIKGDVGITWKRIQLRCMGPSLDVADRVGNHAHGLLNNGGEGLKWIEVTDSDGVKWFVHAIFPTTGPSHHIDSVETWESLFFATIAIGDAPIADSP